MPNDNKFKIIVMAVFGVLLLIGIVVFATYRSSNTSNQQVPITVWGTIDQATFDSFISKFKQDKNLEFTLTYIQKDISTIDSDLVEAIATGREPDAILVPQELEKRYLDKVYLITSIKPRDFQNTYIDEANLYIQPNGIFAVPFAVDPMVMYWNKDLFSSAGVANPPASWSEFPLLASKLTISDQNANITQSLAALGEYRNVDNAKALLSTLIMQAGSPIVTEDASGIFSSALYTKAQGQAITPAVAALNFYTDYANPKKTVYSWNRSLPDSKQSFLAENLAIYFGLASEYDDIKVKNPNLNFDVAMIPQTVGAKNKITFGDLYGFALIKNSPNIVPAFQLIGLLTAADAVSEFTQVSDFAPARRDVIGTGTPDPAKSVFFSSALISEGWLDPDMAKTNQIFQDMVENVTTGRLDADGSVQDASDKLDGVLQ